MTFAPLTSTAVSAFMAGDWIRARDLLDEIVATGDADAEAFAMLAAACLRLDDGPAAHKAAEASVTRDARNLRAILVKADLLTAEANLRGANFYNGLALDLAAEVGELPPDLAQGVARAREARARVKDGMLTLVQDELRSAGYSERGSPRRFTLALDILTGRKQPYFQQPTRFYYPELPNIQFFPRDQFPWLDAVEAATEVMIEELGSVLRDDSTFAPYMRTAPHVPKGADPLIDSLDWSVCPIIKGGERMSVADSCPQTLAALADAPLPRIDASSPDVLFSQLRAGAHIRPHTGAVNTRLICHLPLIVPDGCHFRVGNDVRQWERGKAWVFDDTIEHEAINRSDKPRVILMFDIWRPEIEEEERALITALFEAMYAYDPERGSFST